MKWNWDEIVDTVISKISVNQLIIDKHGYIEFDPDLTYSVGTDTIVLIYYNHAEEKLLVLDDFIETQNKHSLKEVDLNYVETYWKCEWKEVDSLYELGEALNHFKYILKVYRMRDDF